MPTEIDRPLAAGARMATRSGSRIAVLGLLVLASCASYTPKPLPKTVSLAKSVQDLSVPSERLAFPTLASHRFDPSDGLDIDEVAMLAVANNPQLRLARDGVGISRAQSFAAGLLPDPQLGLTADHPTNGATGNTNAFNLSLGYDLGTLVSRSARADAATAEVGRVNLDLLWQEWQTVSQARLLFVRLRSQEKLLDVLEAGRRQLAEAALHSSQALADGNVTLDVSLGDQAALRSLERQINELHRAHLQDQVALDGLLGLIPGSPLTLAGDLSPESVDAPAIRTGIVQRLAKRPDLLAMQAGYRSQEASFRGAVLAQFPALNVGLTRARDTSGLSTLGFALNLSLPIFNANRGNIAIEDATRTKLYDEYQGRLDAADGEVEAALANIPLLQAQRARTVAGEAALAGLLERADAALRRGDMTGADHARMASALLDKRVEGLQLQEALAEQQIALQTLLGPDLPRTAGTRP